ncbi:MAG: SCO family protein [Pseudomonadota bacterium]
MRETTSISVTRRAALGLVVTTSFALPAFSHSLKEVEENLYEKEKYYQPVDVEAPNFTLRDADGRTIGLADFKSKVVVLHFIYASCRDLCPLHAEKIAAVQKMVNITPMRNKVQFVTVTTDPKRDKGQVLRDYGENHGLDPVNWMFLTAAAGEPEDTTRRLAKAYEVEFSLGENGNAQMRGAVTSVIDQEGLLRGRFHGLDFQDVNMVIFINALINKVQVPHADRKSGFWRRLGQWWWP